MSSTIISPITIEYNDFNFKSYAVIIWFVIVTMTTVGYGDIYPRSVPGRLFSFFLCVIGLFLISMMVMVITQTIELSDIETQALEIFNKLILKKELEDKSSVFLSRFYKFRKIVKTSKDDKLIEKYKTSFYNSLFEFKNLNRTYKNEIHSNFNDELNNNLDNIKLNLKNISKKQRQLLNIKKEISILN